jgi:two-component system chemotaxis response regulator CheB
MIRVLVVDDSALVRQLLSSILGSAPGIQVVGTAGDPYVARDRIKQLNPDVLTLDVEMPRMDGLTFLGNLMRLRPMPVVMVSSLTQQGAEVTLRALELGAVDFVAKPKLDVAQGLAGYAEEIVDKIRAAADSHPRPAAAPPRAAALPEVPARLSADVVLARSPPLSHFRTTERVIGIGASTGGTEAIKDVLRELPADMPGIVVTQHIPEAFSGPFAKRLDAACALTVVEARDGQAILPGHAYVAPGSRHLLVARDGARFLCRLNDGPAVNRHKPSVDVMFRSLAQSAGPNAVAVMLTGMGADGAEGTGEMKAAGAPVVAQDERTSVVWGMPGEVVKRGLADDVLPLPRIAARLIELARNSP